MMFSCKCVAVLARRYYALSDICSIRRRWRGLRTIWVSKDIRIDLAIRLRPGLKGKYFLGCLAAA